MKKKISLMASMVLYLIAIIILIYYFSLEFNELLRLSPTGRIVLLLLSCLIMYFGGLALTKYIDEKYNSERLTKILTNVAEMIGARVLNVSSQDYDPQGASVTILLADENMRLAKNDEVEDCVSSKTVLGHLDKSHITVHTYPEYHPETSIATFRVDIDVSTCGEITPLSTLDYLIGNFDSDIITMDYRVRGFTRDVSGRKLFMDHKITSIQDYIMPDTLLNYDAMDINVYQANLFHTRMLIKEPELSNYLFNTDIYEIPPKTRLEISNRLRREMLEIFSGTNVF